MASAVAARAAAASSSAACRAAACPAASARACSTRAVVCARTDSAWASAASGSLAAASWSPSVSSCPRAPVSWPDRRVIAASTSSRMAPARLIAVVTGVLSAAWPSSSARRRNAVSAVWVTSTRTPSRFSETCWPQ